MLSKHEGTTTDTRGTEFSYTCYTQKDNKVVVRKYVCKEFPENSASTLEELKLLMGEL